MSRRITPFSEGDTFSTFQMHIKNIITEIKSHDNDYVLNASPTELEQYYIDKALIKPLILYDDKLHGIDKSAVDIKVTNGFSLATHRESYTVRGTRIDLAVPFEGNPILWRIRASTFSLGGYPDIAVEPGIIIFSVSFSDHAADTAAIQSEINKHISALKGAIAYLNKDVEAHNATAPEKIRAEVHRKIELARKSTGAIAALGIPMVRSDSEPTFKVPLVQRERPVIPPTVAVGPYEPEPTIANDEYLHILDIMKSMSLVIERNPSSFATLAEPAIRDHFLIQLNGHYKGTASGETFNANGKTDILIKEKDRNVFIAECKFWHGQKEFNDAIDQLLSYLSWRDSKCALVVFNRTRNTSGVREKMHETMQARLECKKVVSHVPDGDSRYIFVKKDDPGREIIITTQVYDIPVKEDETATGSLD